MVKLAAAVSAGVTLLGGTAAAAATGNLPTPAQHVVASVLSDFGVSVPGHTKPGSSTASPSNAQTHLPTTPAAQASGASALTGLCRAFLSPGTDRRAARFAVLIQGHGGSSSSVAGFCQSLLSASASGTPTGQNSGTPTPGSRPDQPGSNGQHVGSTSGSGSAPSTVPSGSGAAQQHGRLGPSG